MNFKKNRDKRSHNTGRWLVQQDGLFAEWLGTSSKPAAPKSLWLHGSGKSSHTSCERTKLTNKQSVAVRASFGKYMTKSRPSLTVPAVLPLSTSSRAILRALTAAELLTKILYCTSFFRMKMRQNTTVQTLLYGPCFASCASRILSPKKSKGYIEKADLARPPRIWKTHCSKY